MQLCAALLLSFLAFDSRAGEAGGRKCQTNKNYSPPSALPSVNVVPFFLPFLSSFIVRSYLFRCICMLFFSFLYFFTSRSLYVLNYLLLFLYLSLSLSFSLPFFIYVLLFGLSILSIVSVFIISPPVSLSLSLAIYSFGCLSIHLSYLPICLSVCLSIYLSMNLYIYLSVSYLFNYHQSTLQTRCCACCEICT